MAPNARLFHASSWFYTSHCIWCAFVKDPYIVIKKVTLLISHFRGKVKIKNTLVQGLRLCTGRTAHRASRGIALPFLDHGTRRGWGVSVTPRPLFTPGQDPVPIVQEAGWAPGPVWTGAENLASTGIRSPDRPAHSQSLYRLRYQAHTFQRLGNKFTCILLNIHQIQKCFK